MAITYRRDKGNPADPAFNLTPDEVDDNFKYLDKKIVENTGWNEVTDLGVFYEGSKTFTLNYRIQDILEIEVINDLFDESKYTRTVLPLTDFAWELNSYELTNTSAETVFVDGDQLKVRLRTPDAVIIEPEDPDTPPDIIIPDEEEPLSEISKMYFFDNRVGSEEKDWMPDNFLPTMKFISQDNIENEDDNSQLDLPKLTTHLNTISPTSRAIANLDWERQPFDDLFSSDPVKKAVAEAKYIQMVDHAISVRPNLQFTVYDLPSHGNYASNIANKNEPYGKHDQILSRLSVLNTSLYIFFANEENKTLFGKKGHEGNLEFLRQNLNLLLAAKIRTGKPAVPLFWNRIHSSANPLYQNKFIQPDVLADYVRLIYTHRFQGVGIDALGWWDNAGRVASNQGGLSNWCPVVRTATAYAGVWIDQFTEVQNTLISLQA